MIVINLAGGGVLQWESCPAPLSLPATIPKVKENEVD